MALKPSEILDKQTESNYALMSNTQGGRTATIKKTVSYESDDGGAGRGGMAEEVGPNERVCNVCSCLCVRICCALELHNTRDTARRG